jgi:hypothetical protein
MESNELIRNLKIIVIVTLIIGAIGAILYLIYGFTILWTAMAAGIITGFLSLLVIVFLALSIYLWTRNLLLKRDLKKYKTELHYCKAELKKMRNVDK